MQEKLFRSVENQPPVKDKIIQNSVFNVLQIQIFL